VNGGSGYGSVSDLEQIFGVEAGKTYQALVKFPGSGDTLIFGGLKAGTSLDVYEITGFNAIVVAGGNATARFFKDPENQPEIVKYMLIFLMLFLYNLHYRNTFRRISFFRLGGSLIIFLVFILLNDFYLFSGISFTFFIAPLVALVLLLLMHLVIDRVLLRQLARKEKLELREKLSRDLHDDLASTLGSISIYANTLSSNSDASAGDFRRLSGKVAALTQSALQSISDIIWMTSPRNDSLQSLIAKTGNYMFEILTDNQIGFENVVEIPEEPIILKENIRNEAFLILKEALHNVIRHASASHVVFSASISERECQVSLTDDGVGIDMEARTEKKYDLQGNGLENMRRRARESGIDLAIDSGRNSGTRITLTFRI
jgi:signal transduction histidine kinase